MAKYSPMMMQYFQIKEEYQDCILFFRLGDFYEMFFDDAKLASKELEIALTGRDCGQEERAPMCGVPYHSCESYIAKLISKGYKVAICEQMEDPATAKGIVKRGIVRVVTPGTVVEAAMLDDTKNNFICAVNRENGQFGLCMADISTGAVEVVALGSDASEETVISEIFKFGPREVIVDEKTAQIKSVMEFLHNTLQVSVEVANEELFGKESAVQALLEQFDAETVSDIGFEPDSILISATGALIKYLHQTQKNSLAHIKHVNFYRRDQYMQVDMSARRNLELVETMRSKEKKGSLAGVLDKTRTAAGSRMLRQWMDKPLMNISAIQGRLDAVEELCQKVFDREEIAHELKSVLDIERLLSRIVYGIGNACDLNSIAQTLEVIPKIKEHLAGMASVELSSLRNELDELDAVWRLIRSAISENPLVSVREGKIIREGYDSTVDELRDILKNGQKYIAKMESDEREKTGIKNLKISYNRVFGYYIEVTKLNADLVPDNYIRKQTLANSERYFTEELKELENTILGAHDHVTSLEYEIFMSVCAKVKENIDAIQKNAKALAHLDVLVSFSHVASHNGYVMPKVNQSDVIEIEDGRHPVVEQMLKDGIFVPNDTLLDCSSDRMAIITGPNMAGKSTYMRQVALIVFMAQIGSFVPAKSAKIGVVDKIYTRIGASDDLASGQSTFMVEMSEVAEIIRNATGKSLLILDEIGRGTSTFDGMSVARAVIEYTANKIGAKTLFATHYHELTELEGMVEGVKNYNIAAKKRGFDITFLRKIVRGQADESYGIEVAKLAGIPQEVIDRAKEILISLEADGDRQIRPGMPDAEIIAERAPVNDDERAILDRLEKIDANTLSPIEALNEIFRLSQSVKQMRRESEVQD